MKNQVQGVNINPQNANGHPGDKGAVTAAAAAVDHHLLIKRKDDIAQVVHALLVVQQAVFTLEVLVLAMTLVVLCLAVVQSLDLHPYLGDEGRLAFWIEDELQGKF